MAYRTREDNIEACKLYRKYKQTEEQRRRYRKRRLLVERLERIWRRMK